MEYYSAIKKNEIMPSAATWMDLEMVTLSEISQREKDGYCMLSFICGIRCGIHTMEYYSAIKKNEIMPFAATRMDLEMVTLSEISQREKDGYCMLSFISGI